MADKTKDWVIRLRFDAGKILSEYENTLKRMRDIEKKYPPKPVYPTTPVTPAPKQPKPQAPFSKLGTAIGGGTALDIDLERELNKLSKLKLPIEDAEKFKQKLMDIQQRLNMAQSQREVKRLRGEFRTTTSQIRMMTAEQKRLNRELSFSQKAGSQFAASMKRAGLALASVYAVGRVSSEIFRVGKVMDSQRASLLAASSSTEEAAENFEFLRETSQKLGKDIETGVSGFNRIAIAAKGAGMGTKEARAIFLAASEASTAFSLDQQRTGLVMLAFSQMMSKGRVSMEELSRQLGENLPIAMEAAAMATGKTQAEVIELVSAGKLASEDFMVPFANAVRTLARRNGALAAGQRKMIANQQRMNNAWKFMADEIFQGGGAKSFSRMFNMIADVIKMTTPMIVPVARSLFSLVEGMGAIVKGLFDIIDALGGITVISGIFKSIEFIVDGLLIAIYRFLIGIEQFKNFIGLNKVQDIKESDIVSGRKTLGQKASETFKENPAKMLLPFWMFESTKPRNEGKTVVIDKVEIKANTDNPRDFADEFTNKIMYNFGIGP